jgi:hypothetical protein
MNSRERVFAHLNGQPVDHLPLLPITMQFACQQIGVKYRDYCTDYRVQVQGQIHTAQAFGLDQGFIAFILWGVGNFVGSTFGRAIAGFSHAGAAPRRDGPRLAGHLDLSRLGRSRRIGRLSDLLPRPAEENRGSRPRRPGRGIVRNALAAPAAAPGFAAFSG